MNIPVGLTGNVFIEADKNPAGTCRVIDVAGNECLCLLLSFRSDKDNSLATQASFPVPPTTIAKSNTPPAELRFTVSGKRLTFRPVPDATGFYLSTQAVAGEKFVSLTITAIKKILFAIETETGNGYSADLIDFGQAVSLRLDRLIDFTDKNRIILGTEDGKLCMLVEENGVLKPTTLSSSILEKFKKDLYVYILLKARKQND